MSDEKKEQGILVCTRIISYDEVAPYIKEYSIKEAVDIVLKSEQTGWKKTKSTVTATGTPNSEFFKDCFPRWKYIFQGKTYSPIEAQAAGIVPKIIWNIELKVEYDPKLEAYRILKKE